MYANYQQFFCPAIARNIYLYVDTSGEGVELAPSAHGQEPRLTVTGQTWEACMFVIVIVIVIVN
jgi:hypothetical protein